MGILNVTPDSFFDGNCHNSVDRAVDRAKVLLQEGADLIDVGGESSRPGAETVLLDQEIERVIPVIQALRDQLGSQIFISVDTYKPEVMLRAIEAGADMINDINALRAEGALEIIAEL